MRKIVFRIAIFSALLPCKTKLIVHDFKADNIPNFQNIFTTDSSIVNLVRPYSAELNRKIQKVIAESDVQLIKRQPESSLTNYLSDIFLHEGQTSASRYPEPLDPEVAFLRHGGIRANLPKGQIPVGKFFELMPFENALEDPVLINQAASRGLVLGRIDFIFDKAAKESPVSCSRTIYNQA